MIFELAIIIPCYNEVARLQIETYNTFLLENKNVLLCFVNDGSTDTTIKILHHFKEQYPKQVFIINNSKNQGKAEAVRTGFLTCLSKFEFKKIAYLDADLSTSLQECTAISKKIVASTRFAFGSRIAKLDSNIDRKMYRFLIGRTIATLISNQLKLMVYDTQCGCKVFTKDLAKTVFEKPFISRWLFDVEIFHRLIAIYGKNQLKYIVKEIPLKSWKDTDDSKVPFSYFFKLWYDLYCIGKAYKNPLKTKLIQNENAYN